jgi:hypothetical protein
VWNPGGDDSAGETPLLVGKVAVGGGMASSASAGGAMDGSDADSVGRAGVSRGGKTGSISGGIGGGATDGGDAGSIGRLGQSGDGEDGGGSLDGGLAGQVRGERSNSPPAPCPTSALPRFSTFLFLWLAVKQFQAERVAMGRGSARTGVGQPERQQRDWLTGL